MLDRQPCDVQRLLLRTSLLDRVNGELADLLTGRPGSERILLELEDANAFVVSLDAELSPGELRVLRYLPTNLSRPEVASELSISLNTVNTHLRSIYAKLGVRDRRSAVRRARALRLLGADRTR